MGKVEYIKEIVITTPPQTPDSGYKLIYPETNGLWYEKDNGGVVKIVNWDALKPIIFSQLGITTHLNAINNTTTNAVTENIVLPYDGDYLLTLSFNYNINSNATYGKVFSTFNGNALDLNDRASVPEGNNQILVVEMKDNGNTNGGAITGTGSGNKANYCMQFLLSGQTAGTYPFIIDVGTQQGGVETSVFNILAKFEIINVND